MKTSWRYLFIASQIFAYILAVILIVQLLKLIFGGSWQVEDFILALLMLNISLVFAMFGKINTIDKKLHGHLEWHRAKDN